ncbi:FAD/NAD(P)-dependent oxidoreductase [Marinobacterium arenosum]|uniref:FAD/NAD(P)-dependent oxidoreductase n=1 Tax=Marinobacterium arenosum TaxID=2862496 RepID=UPI001C98BB6C|nr:NAD(P)/FAD-dependent oxidoreductase [Marinobacterium arenosum]MBY4675360.1 NAD(P)/FAD-dependent oxidoreductase [Marinobacterium arenosum]
MDADLAIVGAGPAGMAAAVQARQLGLSVVLLDEQPRAGGQIYRNIERPALRDRAILGPDYYAGAQLAEAFRDSGCRHISGATVWQITPEGQLFYSSEGASASLNCRHVLIASGAQERPMPIPGWTLPGVMTAGAAQILLKNPGLAAQDAVFAGSGPLLYLIVWQYLQAGIRVKAVLDTMPAGNYRSALRQLGGALRGRHYLIKGLKLFREIKRAGIPFIRGVTELEALGDSGSGVSQVRYRAKGRQALIDTRQLFLHQGVVPNVNLAMASGCEHRWNDRQLCWTPKLDPWGQSSQSHISIAGDGSGIGGAVAAALRGRLAVQQIACLLGRQTAAQRDASSRQWRRQLQRELAFRPFLDTLYRPTEPFRKPVREEVMVCRCEEVTLGDIRAAAAQGCMGPNQLKSFTRCGMGPCQGRQCGLTVSELMAELNQQPVEDSGYYRLRAPVKPLNLGELATLADPAATIDQETANEH